MIHSFFFDGNSKGIAWRIQTEKSNVEQKRKHPDIYLNKVNDLQAKYIAFHVGLFWGIGRFIIHNEDELNAKIDDELMYNHMVKNEKNTDELIEKRSYFIFHLLHQRKLKVNYQKIHKTENPVSRLI